MFPGLHAQGVFLIPQNITLLFHLKYHLGASYWIFFKWLITFKAAELLPSL